MKGLALAFSACHLQRAELRVRVAWCSPRHTTLSIISDNASTDATDDLPRLSAQPSIQVRQPVKTALLNHNYRVQAARRQAADEVRAVSNKPSTAIEAADNPRWHPNLLRAANDHRPPTRPTSEGDRRPRRHSSVHARHAQQLTGLPPNNCRRAGARTKIIDSAQLAIPRSPGRPHSETLATKAPRLRDRWRNGGTAINGLIEPTHAYLRNQTTNGYACLGRTPKPTGGMRSQLGPQVWSTESRRQNVQPHHRHRSSRFLAARLRPRRRQDSSRCMVRASSSH